MVVQGTSSDVGSTSFDRYLVLDLSATCIKDMRINPQEIIEFPCALVDATDGFRVVRTFHSYVKPVYRPKLSPFCIKLTGVRQHMVDSAEAFPAVLSSFLRWAANECALAGSRTVFATSGDWDLLHMMPAQCRLAKVKVPAMATSWVNVSAEFRRLTSFGTPSGNRRFDVGLEQMCRHLGLEAPVKGSDGGTAKVRCLARVLQQLCQKGALRVSQKAAALEGGRLPATIEGLQVVSEGEDGTEEASKGLESLLQPNAYFRPQPFAHLLLVDLKTTAAGCDARPPSTVLEEAIELSCLVLETAAGKEVGRFHRFSRPLRRPRLSPLCTRATGITQAMVDRAGDFAEVFVAFNGWLKERLANVDKLPLFCAFGGWQTAEAIFSQELESTDTDGQRQNHKEHRQWVDLKQTFATATGMHTASHPSLLVMETQSADDEHITKLSELARTLMQLTEIAPAMPL